ncbi:MAG: tyrosine-type recombinase/integrase [Gemmatimonadota bacterium]
MGITLHHLLDRYVESETPYKSRSKQGHDRRTAAMLKRFFAASRGAETLNLGDWNRFIRARREYRIGPPVTLMRAREAERKGKPLQPIGDRQIEYDLRFLWAVLTWGTRTGDARGRVLVARHPLKDCVHARHWPRERSPDRPALTGDQYRKLVDVASSMDWRFRVALTLAHETGHRIGSIRRLRWSDVEAREGWIRWRADADKMGRAHRTPVTEGAREALELAARHRDEPWPPDRALPAWLLPSPSDPSRPCSRNIMRDWWNRAQERAGLGGIPRLGWHALRRKFANDLRHVPLKDLASLGGWKDTRTLLKCYLTEDEEAMVEALGSRRSPHQRGGDRGEE